MRSVTTFSEGSCGPVELLSSHQLICHSRRSLTHHDVCRDPQIQITILSPRQGTGVCLTAGVNCARLRPISGTSTINGYNRQASHASDSNRAAGQNSGFTRLQLGPSVGVLRMAARIASRRSFGGSMIALSPPLESDLRRLNPGPAGVPTIAKAVARSPSPTHAITDFSSESGRLSQSKSSPNPIRKPADGPALSGEMSPVLTQQYSDV